MEITCSVLQSINRLIKYLKEGPEICLSNNLIIGSSHPPCLWPLNQNNFNHIGNLSPFSSLFSPPPPSPIPCGQQSPCLARKSRTLYSPPTHRTTVRFHD